MEGIVASDEPGNIRVAESPSQTGAVSPQPILMLLLPKKVRSHHSSDLSDCRSDEVCQEVNAQPHNRA